MWGLDEFCPLGEPYPTSDGGERVSPPSNYYSMLHIRVGLWYLLQSDSLTSTDTKCDYNGLGRYYFSQSSDVTCLRYVYVLSTATRYLCISGLSFIRYILIPQQV